MTDIIDLLVVSLISGFGTAIGNFLATRSLIKRMEKGSKT